MKKMDTNRTAATYPSGTNTDTDSAILRKYYKEHEYPLSPEGILKVISVILCIASSVVLLSSGACAGAAPAAGGAALALAGAALLALLYAAAALALRHHAPMGCLFMVLEFYVIQLQRHHTRHIYFCLITAVSSMGLLCSGLKDVDLVLSTVIGVLLLVSAVLSMTLCDLERGIDYVHGPLSIVTACCVLGSAVLTYAGATRRWDAARPRRAPARPAPTEHDV